MSGAVFFGQTCYRAPGFVEQNIATHLDDAGKICTDTGMALNMTGTLPRSYGRLTVPTTQELQNIQKAARETKSFTSQSAQASLNDYKNLGPVVLTFSIDENTNKEELLQQINARITEVGMFYQALNGTDGPIPPIVIVGNCKADNNKIANFETEIVDKYKSSRVYKISGCVQTSAQYCYQDQNVVNAVNAANELRMKQAPMTPAANTEAVTSPNTGRTPWAKNLGASKKNQQQNVTSTTSTSATNTSSSSSMSDQAKALSANANAAATLATSTMTSNLVVGPVAGTAGIVNAVTGTGGKALKTEAEMRDDLIKALDEYMNRFMSEMTDEELKKLKDETKNTETPYTGEKKYRDAEKMRDYDIVKANKAADKTADKKSEAYKAYENRPYKFHYSFNKQKQAENREKNWELAFRIHGELVQAKNMDAMMTQRTEKGETTPPAEKPQTVEAILKDNVNFGMFGITAAPRGKVEFFHHKIRSKQMCDALHAAHDNVKAMKAAEKKALKSTTSTTKNK